MNEKSNKTNSVVEAPKDETKQKPEHVIKAEISVEIIGEDEPEKPDKYRERCGVVEFWSLLVFVLSTLFFFLVDMNAYAFWTAVVSGFTLTIACGCDLAAFGSKGHSPWWYGGL